MIHLELCLTGMMAGISIPARGTGSSALMEKSWFCK